MLKASALLIVLTALLLTSALADDNGFTCNCDDEGFWSIQTILECQRVSDFLIAVAYFSIPIELLYFVSFSNVPFKWVLVQFIAFIVLCGLTHLLNGWTYYGPHSFQLMLSLTIAKFLTALVSCATAITLLTLIPLLLKWKVRELFLRQNVLELDQEVGMMKKQKEASWHVRMLTREIRKSLDKHTILYTTLVELSKTLELHNCVVWMPNESATALNLTHELKPSSSKNPIPIKDPDVVEIKRSKGVVILRSDSILALSSSSNNDGSNSNSNPSDDQSLGAVAGIRMPLLQVSNFKGGTPEFVDTRYAILILVLPSSRKWSYPEMEIVEVVADQVAVALSHAAVLEESQLMREKLGEQNRALQQARKNVVMASAARNSFEKVMSHGMRRPMHSLVGLLSILQDHETMSSEQKLLIDSMVKTTGVLSTLINDVMILSAKSDGKFPLEMRPFQLHSLIKEASCLAKCLCIYKRFGFSVVVQSSLPDWVMGDERRTFQVILHMVGYLLDTYLEGGESVVFRVLSASNSESRNQRNWTPGMPTVGDSVFVKFEIEICSRGLASSSTSDASVHEVRYNSRGSRSKLSTDSLGFTICKKLVQMMQGDIWMASSSQALPEKMTLVLRFPLQSIQGREYMLARRNIPENLFRGLHILLTDDDDVNRTVTKKQLEKLGCQVTAVSSGFECLSALSHTDCSFKVVFLDLYLSDMDGFEVATRIRKFRSRNWPLIIALTASTEEQLAGKCLQAGMNGLVQKPAVLQTLADEISRVLNRVGG